MEQWKDIKGYEGLYQVSNLGRVKTIKTNKIRKLEKVRSGYLRVMLCKNNKSERFLVHRLVAEAFINNASIINIIFNIISLGGNNMSVGKKIRMKRVAQDL